MAPTETQGFPRVFWTANVTELFERAAYYSMASFVVIYLGQLGLGEYWPSNLNSVLWTLVYFLPDPLRAPSPTRSGSGSRSSSRSSCSPAGYFLMGYPVWFGGAELVAGGAQGVHRAARRWSAPSCSGILLIGIGGSVIKPCISGTVQKTSGTLATLGFAIFYMVINIGSLFGRGTAFVVRTRPGVVLILARRRGLRRSRPPAHHSARQVEREPPARRRGDVAVTHARATCSSSSAPRRHLLWLLRLGRPDQVDRRRSRALLHLRGRRPPRRSSRSSSCSSSTGAGGRRPARPAKPRRSVGRILLDMVLVLKQRSLHPLPARHVAASSSSTTRSTTCCRCT